MKLVRLLIALALVPLQLLFNLTAVAAYFFRPSPKGPKQPCPSVSRSRQEASDITDDILACVPGVFIRGIPRTAAANGWFWAMDRRFAHEGLKATCGEDLWPWAVVASEIYSPEIIKWHAECRTAGPERVVRTRLEFYAASAAIALAAKVVGGKWTMIYWWHFVTKGGLLWAICGDANESYSDTEKVARLVWTIAKCRGVGFCDTLTMERILSSRTNMNPFIMAHAANLGMVRGLEKECESRLLTFGRGCFFATPARDPDERSYFDDVKTPKVKSVTAFALKLLWRVK